MTSDLKKGQQPRKLLIVIPTLDQSGAEKQFCILARELVRRGMEVEVVALSRGGPLKERLTESGISVEILNKDSGFDFQAIRRLRKVIKKRTPDIVLSCLFAGNAYARLATFFSGEKRPKVVISERCVDTWKNKWQIWFDRRLQSSADALVANSNSVADFYQNLGVPAEKIRMIPNAIEVPAKANITRDKLCEELKIPMDARLIAYVGRLAPQKRIRDMLWAIHLLRLSLPTAYLLIIGDGPEREELEEYADEVQVSQQIRFLGHREDAASVLHLIDVFWLASEFEGMSNSLMEAMACGKPVVVSDIRANKELVDHSINGFHSKLGDSVGYVQATVKLFEDSELVNQIGLAAARKMQQQYTTSRMVDSYISLFNEICS